MELLYKEDWEEAKKRLSAWWSRALYGGRPAFQIRAPRDKPLPHGPEPPEALSPQQRWLDVPWRIACAEYTFARTIYLGEAFPYFDTTLGPGSLALHLGAEGKLTMNTVWYGPCLKSLPETPLIQRVPEDPYWKLTLELARESARRGQGKYLSSIPDLIENLDTLASLRGTQELLLDLLDAPQHVQRLLGQIQAHWFAVYEEIYQIIKDPQDGGSCFTAFQIWGPGKVAKLQSDISCMLGPEMFREFEIPLLKKQTEWLDYSLYHWDGPGAIKHLEALLELPRLNAIQWMPGAGCPPASDPQWFPLYRRIREAGKGLLLTSFPAEKAEVVYKEFGPAGVMVSCYVERETEGRRLLEESAKWQ